MIINCILSAVTVFLILYIAMIFKSTALTMLVILLVLELLSGIIYTIIVSKKVKVIVMVPITLSEINRESSVMIKTINYNRFIVKKLKIKLSCIANNNLVSTKKIIIKDIVPGTSVYKCVVKINMSGNFHFSTEDYTIYDIFGLWRLKKRNVSGENMIILPGIYDVGITIGQNIINFFSDTDYYDELRPGYDPNEVFKIREFRAGDRLQNVHWKLSAKNNDFIVKENSFPKACPIVLIIDRNVMNSQKSMDAVASVSFSLMDNKQPHYAAWFSAKQKEIIRARIDDEESFYLFITSFLCDIDKQPHDNLIDLYKSKYRSEVFLYTVEFDNNKIIINNITYEFDRLEESELIFY